MAFLGIPKNQTLWIAACTRRFSVAELKFVEFELLISQERTLVVVIRYIIGSKKKVRYLT